MRGRFRGLMVVLALTVAGALAPGTSSAAPGDLKSIDVERDGAGGVGGIAGASDVLVSPDGKHVYATGSVDGAVAWFRRSRDGRLTFQNSIADGNAGADGLAGANSLAISPDGSNVYVAGQLDDAVTVFSRSSATGSLTFVESVRDGTGGVELLEGAAGVEVSPDGSSVYVAALEEDALSLFERDESDGSLTLVETYVEDLLMPEFQRIEGPFAFASDPGGTRLFLAALEDDALTSLARDPATGELMELDIIDGGTTNALGFDGTTAVALTPNARFAYTVATFDGALTASRIDAQTGELTLAGYAQDGEQGLQALGGASDVAISSEGTTAYVTAGTDDALSGFRLNDRTGRIASSEFLSSGARQPLDGAAAITMSSDDRHAYVAADEGAITAFRRTPVPIVDRLRVPERQPGPKLVLAARCSRACEVRVSATGRTDGRPFKAEGAERELRDGKPRTFRLKLPARTDRKAGPARIMVRAKDAFGGKQRLVRRVRLVAP